MAQQNVEFSLDLGDLAQRLGLANPVVYRGHNAEVLCYLVLPHSKRALTHCADGCLDLWSLETGEMIYRNRLSDFEYYQVSPDGNWLALQLMIDSGNSQQESLDLQYIGCNSDYGVLSHVYLDLMHSNGLDVWFNTDSSELWVDRDWDHPYEMNDECLRSYKLDPKHKELPVLAEYNWAKDDNDVVMPLAEARQYRAYFCFLDCK